MGQAIFGKFSEDLHMPSYSFCKITLEQWSYPLLIEVLTNLSLILD